MWSERTGEFEPFAGIAQQLQQIVNGIKTQFRKLLVAVRKPFDLDRPTGLSSIRRGHVPVDETEYVNLYFKACKKLPAVSRELPVVRGRESRTLRTAPARHRADRRHSIQPVRGAHGPLLRDGDRIQGSEVNSSYRSKRHGRTERCELDPVGEAGVPAESCPERRTSSRHAVPPISGFRMGSAVVSD